MADVTMTVVPTMEWVAAAKVYVTDIFADADAEAGNAAATGNYFYFPNDGKTVILAWGGATGCNLVFTAVTDKYGRTESLSVVLAIGKAIIVGPFLPELWNQAGGKVKFQPDAENADDKLIAMSVKDPS